MSVKWREFAQSSGKKFKEGAALALLAMIGFGLIGFFLKFAVDALGIFYSLIVYRTVTLAILLPMGGKAKKEPVSGIPLLVGIGILEALANISYTAGLSAGLVSLVSAVISTETIIAVVLAFLFLRERLTKAQAIGIAAVVAGLVGLGLFG